MALYKHWNRGPLLTLVKFKSLPIIMQTIHIKSVQKTIVTERATQLKRDGNNSGQEGLPAVRCERKLDEDKFLTLDFTRSCARC